MSLVDNISAAVTAIGAQLKDLLTRATALEARIETVQLTQAEYDALDPPDAGTLYVITG